MSRERGFDPNDPFPLLPAPHDYAEAQKHAEKVDAWLGFRIAEIEEKLAREREEASAFPDEQHWIGLKAQALLTPYTELRRMLEDLAPQPGQLVVDLGAGYGRMGLVMARHFPEAQFLGLEIVPERVAEGARVLAAFGAKNARLSRADLTAPEFRLPSADFYFLYDYGNRDAIEKTLQDLRMLASQRAVTVIGRGRATRDAIERRHPWLSEICPPLHRGNYSIYRSGS